MTMKKILAILFLLVFAAGCEKEDILLSERNLIEKYLADRKIYSESEVGSVIQDNPPFYQVFGRYAYRHIVNYYDNDRVHRRAIKLGDKVKLRFNAYIFNGKEPSTPAIYWSNVPSVIKDLGDRLFQQHTINSLKWSTDPLIVKLGETEILEGLELTLQDCYEGDSIQVYISSNLAYGNKPVGVIPKNSMVAWYIKIMEIRPNIPGFGSEEIDPVVGSDFGKLTPPVSD